MKGGERVAVGERGAQPRGIELRRNEIALQMAQFGIAYRRVELDQHVPRLDGLTIPDMDRAHDADLEGLHDFAAAGRDDLALRRGDHVDLADARPGERGAKRRK